MASTAAQTATPGHATSTRPGVWLTDITLVALSSETVVDYSLRLKREIGTPVVWVAGYSNDVVGYIPSRRVASEGGYEAGYDFTFDVEDKIIKLVHDLAAGLQVPIRRP